jgi:hypothetical protein
LPYLSHFNNRQQTHSAKVRGNKVNPSSILRATLMGILQIHGTPTIRQSEHTIGNRFKRRNAPPTDITRNTPIHILLPTWNIQTSNRSSLPNPHHGLGNVNWQIRDYNSNTSHHIAKGQDFWPLKKQHNSIYPTDNHNYPQCLFQTKYTAEPHTPQQTT